MQKIRHWLTRGRFRTDQYTPSQLFLISHNRLAQFWEGFAHISYFERVDIDALLQLPLRTPTDPDVPTTIPSLVPRESTVAAVS